MPENEYRVLEDRQLGYLPDGTELRYIECYGTSTWTKPTAAPNGAKPCAGSKAVETDTGTVFLWDAVAGDWVEQFTFQGQGS